MDWKKWKGRLSHSGWEVKKPEIRHGATEGGREEVDAFSRYFISHLGHQVSWISGDRLETHPNLSMVSYEGLTVAHVCDLVTDGWWHVNVILLLFLFHHYLKVGILLASLGSQGRDRRENCCGDVALWWKLKLWLNEDNHYLSNLLEPLFVSACLLQMKVILLFSCSLMSVFEIIVSWYLCSVSGFPTSFQFLYQSAAVQVDSTLRWIFHWDHLFGRSCCCICPFQSVLHLSVQHKYEMRGICTVLYCL